MSTSRALLALLAGNGDGDNGDGHIQDERAGVPLKAAGTGMIVVYMSVHRHAPYDDLYACVLYLIFVDCCRPPLSRRGDKKSGCRRTFNEQGRDADETSRTRPILRVTNTVRHMRVVGQIRVLAIPAIGKDDLRAEVFALVVGGQVRQLFCSVSDAFFASFTIYVRVMDLLP